MAKYPLHFSNIHEAKFSAARGKMTGCEVSCGEITSHEKNYVVNSFYKQGVQYTNSKRNDH